MQLNAVQSVRARIFYSQYSILLSPVTSNLLHNLDSSLARKTYNAHRKLLCGLKITAISGETCSWVCSSAYHRKQTSMVAFWKGSFCIVPCTTGCDVMRNYNVFQVSTPTAPSVTGVPLSLSYRRQIFHIVKINFWCSLLNITNMLTACEATENSTILNMFFKHLSHKYVHHTLNKYWCCYVCCWSSKIKCWLITQTTATFPAHECTRCSTTSFLSVVSLFLQQTKSYFCLSECHNLAVFCYALRSIVNCFFGLNSYFTVSLNLYRNHGNQISMRNGMWLTHS